MTRSDICISLIIIVGITSTGCMTYSTADSALLMCVPDGEACTTNSDCCSGDCDRSNGKRVCFPKL